MSPRATPPLPGRHHRRHPTVHWIAALQGHEGAVRVLVTEGNAAIDLANNCGLNMFLAPLSTAAAVVATAAIGANLAVRFQEETAEDLARAAAFLGAVAG